MQPKIIQSRIVSCLFDFNQNLIQLFINYVIPLGAGVGQKMTRNDKKEGGLEITKKEWRNLWSAYYVPRMGLGLK